MHNSYFVLKQVAAYLNNRIAGHRLVSCFSQEKDELILVFLGPDHHESFIRADLRSSFSCLSFPETFARSRKNTIDLLPQLSGKTLREAITFQFERLLLLRFIEGFDLLFKMFGTQSNIMLFENNQGIDQFKKNKKNDEDFRLADYDRKYDLSFQKFMESENAPGKFIPAFDKNISEYLDRKNYNTLAATEKYDLISETLGDLENPEVYYVTERNDVTRFTLFKPSEKPHAAFRQVNEALNHFYKSGIHNFQLKTEKTKHAVSIRHAIDKAEKYIRQAQLKLDVIRNNINFKQVADNLMAHLNSIPEGAEKVTLTDVYSGKEIEIRLKSGLSAQKNAELYYRKSKNQDIEIGKLQSAIEEKKISIHKLATRLEELENIRDLKELRKSGMIPDKKTPGDNPSKQSVFREFSCQGYRILIGKSSVNNDSLTFGEGVKEDLWMHARDVPGSHVLVKYQSGKVFPQPVIERAAELAAYFSKNRNNTLCPVIYTPRKYVRKRKGAPAGQVIVEREEIIMVRPKL